MEELKPVETQSTAKKVLTALREAIFTGKLQPGQRITQTNLAKQLNVSITPVREALMTLETEQLVKLVAHKETIILGVNRKYLEDYYNTRSVLEEYLIKLVCSEGVDITKIERAYKKMELIVKQKNYDEYNTANSEFHNAIHEAAGNNFIANFLSRISISISAAKNTSLEKYVEISFNEHKRLIKYIREHDSENAVNEVHNHMMRSLEDILTYYPQ